MKLLINLLRKTFLSFRWWLRRHPTAHPWVWTVALLAIIVTASWWIESAPRLTSWQRNYWALPQLTGERSPAAEGSCQPLMSATQFSTENHRLEQLWPKKHTLIGQWLHWQLSELPFAEARLLSRLSEADFRPWARELKNCQNIECLYNTVSGDSERLYGALAWQWFLKTGIALTWRGTEASFSTEELKELLTLTETLGPEFFHQHLLTTIEKTPLTTGVCFEARQGLLKISPACQNLKAQVTAGMSELLLPHWVKQFPDWQSRLLGSTRSFEDIKNFEQKLDQWVWRDLKNHHLKNCLDLHKAALFNRPTWRGIASLSTPHPLAQCVRNSTVDEFLQAKRLALTQGPHACAWKSADAEGRVPLDEYLLQWEKIAHKDLDQLEWRLRANGLSWLSEYQERETALRQLDPTWVYFDCHTSTDPKSCYQQGLSDLLTHKARVPASVRQDILDDYPFEALAARVRQDVGMKRQWLLAALEASAERVWQQCWRQGPNSMVVASKLNWLETQHSKIDGRFARCLDKASPEILGQLAPGDSPESRYWRQELALPLKHWWSNEISRASEMERQWLWQQKTGIVTALSQDLTTRLKEVPHFDVKAQCPIRLTYHYPSKLYFHHTHELNGYLADKLCHEVLENSPLKAQIEKHQRLQEQQLKTELSLLLTSELKERLQKNCFGRVPANQQNDQALQDCAAHQFAVAWPLVVEEVAHDWQMRPESLASLRQDLESITQTLLPKRP